MVELTQIQERYNSPGKRLRFFKFSHVFGAFNIVALIPKPPLNRASFLWQLRQLQVTQDRMHWSLDWPVKKLEKTLQSECTKRWVEPNGVHQGGVQWMVSSHLYGLAWVVDCIHIVKRIRFRKNDYKGVPSELFQTYKIYMWLLAKGWLKTGVIGFLRLNNPFAPKNCSQLAKFFLVSGEVALAKQAPRAVLGRRPASGQPTKQDKSSWHPEKRLQKPRKSWQKKTFMSSPKSWLMQNKQTILGFNANSTCRSVFWNRKREVKRDDKDMTWNGGTRCRSCEQGNHRIQLCWLVEDAILDFYNFWKNSSRK